MKQITVVALLSVFVATPALAEADGAADSQGTVHVGVKAGFMDYANDPTGVGVYGGYTIIGPNTFKSNAFFSKISIAIEGEHSTSIASGNNKVSTFGFAGAATYPINKQFSAIAKAGVARSSSKNAPASSYNNDVGLHGGIAGQYNLNHQIGLLAGYDFYPKFEMWSIGVKFKFK